MSVSDFKDYFEGKSTLEECKSVTDVNLGITELEIDKEYISFYMVAGNNDVMAVANMMGQFYTDETLYNAGVDASVGYLVDMLEDNASLLFQVFNGTEEDSSLLFHKELSGKPHMKVYLIDEEENMYFYEFELPSVFADVHADGEPKTKVYDTWYKTFFEEEKEEVEG